MQMLSVAAALQHMVQGGENRSMLPLFGICKSNMQAVTTCYISKRNISTADVTDMENYQGRLNQATQTRMTIMRYGYQAHVFLMPYHAPYQ